MSMEFWHWLLIAITLISIEMLAPGFFFLWMAISAFLVGGLLFLLPSLMIEWQLFIFSILSISSIVVWRNHLKIHPDVTDHPLLNQRTAQIIGRVFNLEQAIINGQGKIKVGDSFWKVQGEDCTIGEKVKVIAAKGTVLDVEKL